MRVFPTPCLGCLWGKTLWKTQFSPQQPLRKEARENRKQKETEKSLDFLRLESQKKHKTKSVTFIKLVVIYYSGKTMVSGRRGEGFPQ